MLPVTRWRSSEEFVPDRGYVYSAEASVDAVVAALYCTTVVHEDNWARALSAHAPRGHEDARGRRTDFAPVLPG